MTGRPSGDTVPSVRQALVGLEPKRLLHLICGLRVIGDGQLERGHADFAEYFYACMVEAAEYCDSVRDTESWLDLELEDLGSGGLDADLDGDNLS